MGVTCTRCAGSNSKRATFCSFCGNKLFSSEVNQFNGSFNAPHTHNMYNMHAQGSTSAFSLPQQQAVAPSAPLIRQPGPMVQNAATPIPVSLSIKNDLNNNYQQHMQEKLIKHGCLTSHASWLLEGKYVQAFLVHSAILNSFRQHTLPGLQVSIEKWSEQGSINIRDYIMVQRGISTIFIYVVPSGRDLYLSRTTVVSPKISSTKITILSALFTFLLLGCFLTRSMDALEQTVNFTGVSSLYDTFLSSSVAQITIPLLTIFLFLCCLLVCALACVSWYSKKDLWHFLRSDHLNPLQIDDNAILEQATDHIIRNVVKQLGMEATNAKISPQGSLQAQGKLSTVGQVR